MAALLRLIFSFLLLVSAALAGTEGVFNSTVCKKRLLN